MEKLQGHFAPSLSTSLSGAVLPEAPVNVCPWCTVFFCWYSNGLVWSGLVWSGLGGQGLQQSDGPAEETASWERSGIPQGLLSDRTLCALRQETPHARKYLSDHYSRL